MCVDGVDGVEAAVVLMGAADDEEGATAAVFAGVLRPTAEEAKRAPRGAMVRRAVRASILIFRCIEVQREGECICFVM